MASTPSPLEEFYSNQHPNALKECDRSIKALVANSFCKEALCEAKNAYCRLLDITNKPTPDDITIFFANIEKKQSLSDVVVNYVKTIPKATPGRGYHIRLLITAMEMSDLSLAESLVSVLMKQEPCTFGTYLGL